MPLIEYVEKIKGSSKHPLYKFTYLLFFFSYQFLGFTPPWCVLSKAEYIRVVDNSRTPGQQNGRVHGAFDR
jgi:hypothetical protein